MKNICFTLAISMIATCGFSQNQTSINAKTLTATEQQVWDKVLELHKAVFGSKDAEVISSLVGSDLHYGHSGGNIEDKAVMVKNASQSKTKYENVSNELVSMTIVGNVAMVRMVLRAISIESEMPSPLDLGILQVWAKDKGKWQLLERQAVKVNVKR